MKKLVKRAFLYIGVMALLVQCKPNEDKGVVKILEPQPFPTTYGFPVAEATLIAYTQDYKDPDNIEGIYTHAWQIWSGLTQETEIKTSNGHKVRVFESWRTPGQIKAEETLTEKNLFPLTVPHQLGHGATKDNDSQLGGFVKYSPGAEKHVVQQGLFDQKVAKSLIASGASQIIGFPTNSIMIKPVFLPVKLGDASKNTINVWQGPPANGEIKVWGPKVWPNSTITIVKDASEADGETKFAISDFINFKVDETFTTGFANFKPGDYAVLVGMHVMTKETTRWTWQSFWWSQYPDKPHFPSSKLHASFKKNVKLDGAAKHYAMTVAYSMKEPTQPYINGKNVGESLYAYNPYLEASFGPKTAVNPNNRVLLGENEDGVYKGKSVKNNYGIQTTCMSCHIQARWPQDTQSLNYNGNRYVDFQQSYGKDTLQLDFLWSVNAALGNPKK